MYVGIYIYIHTLNIYILYMIPKMLKFESRKRDIYVHK